MMGLASGMDTDFIIQQTLRMHQFKIDNQLRNKKLIEWRQQTHTSIKDEITSLRQTFLSNLGSKSMMNRNAFNSTISSVTGANSNKVSIRTNAGSPLGNFSINSVSQLAKGAHLNTASGVSANSNGFATTSRLGDLRFGSGEGIDWDQAKGTIRVGGQDISVERNGDEFTFKNSAGVDIGDFDGDKYTLTVGGKIHNLTWDSDNGRFIENTGVFSATFSSVIPDGGGDARDITVSATFDGDIWNFTTNIEGAIAFLDGDNLVVNIEGEGGTTEVFTLGEWNEDTQEVDGTAFTEATNTVAGNFVGETTLTINGVDIKISANDTLSDLITRVNNSAAGVRMSYDRLTDQFTLEARTGTNIDPTGTSLSLSSDSNFFNLISGSSGAFEIKDGQTAKVKINGEDEYREFNTNTFDFRGVNVTLNDTFDDGPVNISLTRDTDRAFNAVKDFIDSYNSIIRRLEGLLSERKSGSEVSYKPLTDEEKQGMTDRQIEEWEAIAKKGILRNDQGIQNLVSSLRRSFFENIEGLGVSPSQIGLTTGSFFDGTGGQIMINEERLREAIERDPDMVADVFIRIDNSGDSPRGVGLLHKIDGLMRDYVNVSQTTSIRNLEDSLKRTNEQIQKMQERMFTEEDRLYRVFASMETAMQKLNQQGAWFSSMLGQ